MEQKTYSYTNDSGEEIVFTYPYEHHIIPEKSVMETFKRLDFNRTKMTHLENGSFVFIYAMVVVSTKFGDALYCMDYKGAIYKTNKRETTRFKRLSAKPQFATDKPLCVIEIVGDAEYMSHPYKEFNLVYIDDNLSVRDETA